jgi:hypothetical protein
VELKRKAALFISVGLVAATGSIALTSVVGFSFSSGPATARLVTQSLVQSSSSSAQSALHTNAADSTASTSPSHPAR